MTDDGGRDDQWKLVVLRQLSDGPISLNALMARFDGVSPDAIRRFIDVLRRTGIVSQPSVPTPYDVVELTSVGDRLCCWLKLDAVANEPPALSSASPTAQHGTLTSASAKHGISRRELDP